MKKYLLLSLICFLPLVAAPEKLADELDFSRLNTLHESSPHLTLTYDKVTTYRDQDLPVPAYRLKVSGSEEGRTYVLLTCHLDKSVTREELCSINGDGYLMTPDDTEEPLLLMMGGFAPGEPVDHYVIGRNRQECAAAHLVPRPIQSLSDAGYALSIELTGDSNRRFCIRASGFDPKESVTLASLVDGEEKTQLTTASKKGEVAVLMLPGSEAEEGGETNLVIKASQGIVSATFPWGANYDDWKTQLAEQEESLDVVIEKLSEKF